MRSGILILICICMVITACDSPQLATVPPSPQPIRITIPPFLAPITNAVHACAVEHDEFAVLLDPSPSLRPDTGVEKLSFWWGENPDLGSYAIPIAQDDLKIIIHPQNPNDALSLEQILTIFAGQVENWSDFSNYQQPINFWVYPDGNFLGQIFQSEFLAGSHFSSLAHIAPSPESMVIAVANDQGAIGFVLQSWIEDNVASVQVESVSNSELQKPILAITNSDPEGELRILMACLQSGVGQSSLLKFYSPVK